VLDTPTTEDEGFSLLRRAPAGLYRGSTSVLLVRVPRGQEIEPFGSNVQCCIQVSILSDSTVRTDPGSCRQASSWSSQPQAEQVFLEGYQRSILTTGLPIHSGFVLKQPFESTQACIEHTLVSLVLASPFVLRVSMQKLYRATSHSGANAPVVWR
jgi:hypothetical protein